MSATNIDPALLREGANWLPIIGNLPPGDNASIDTAGAAFANFQNMLNLSINAGSAFSVPIVSTYSLAYTTTQAYAGGVLDLLGNVQFIPYSTAHGQKIQYSTG